MTIAGRPRKKRREPAIARYIRAWESTVRDAEADSRSRRTVVICTCDECTYEAGRLPFVHPRDALERVIRRGGKTGRRVAKLVAPLDDRFRAATENMPWCAPVPDGLWWHARTPPDAVHVAFGG